MTKCLALAFIAALFAGCGGGGSTASVLPSGGTAVTSANAAHATAAPIPTATAVPSGDVPGGVIIVIPTPGPTSPGYCPPGYYPVQNGSGGQITCTPQG